MASASESERLPGGTVRPGGEFPGVSRVVVDLEVPFEVHGIHGLIPPVRQGLQGPAPALSILQDPP